MLTQTCRGVRAVDKIPHETKRCTRCKVLKPLTAFHRNSRKPQGRESRCTECTSLVQRQRREEDPASARAAEERYRAKHREELRQRDQQRYWANPERYREKSRRERQVSPECAQQAVLKWRGKNRNRYEQIKRECDRDYYERNRESILERNRDWCQQNPERVRAKSTRAARKRRAHIAGAVGEHKDADIQVKFQLQGGLCYYCKRPLSTYHVEHKIPLSRGGSNWPANLCCACPECNWTKGTMTALELDAERVKRLAGVG